jgi:GGDEF domain-containing protein
MTALIVSTLLTATVVVTCGVLFLLETIVRRDTGAGRIWSLAFLSGMLTVVCYLVWSIAEPGRGWLAVAIGNGALVGTVAFLWLGCRSFNDRRLGWGFWVIAAAAFATMAAAIAEGPDGGDWAGAVVMFLAIAGFSICGLIESRRRPMGQTVISFALTAVLAITALYYLLRTLVFVTMGPESELFERYFGNLTTSIATTALTIVAMMAGSILRGRDPFPRKSAEYVGVSAAGADVLTAAAFEAALETIVSRARANSERVAVIALRMDDLPQIGMAFGSAAREEVADEWREGVRKYAPPFALVAEGGPTSMLVAFPPSSTGDARRIASRIHRRVVDDYTADPVTPTPVMGVGVALSDSFGYDVATLRRAANDAAFVSASSPDASVVVAGVA